MEEKPWWNRSSQLEMDEEMSNPTFDEDFLRDILQQPAAAQEVPMILNNTCSNSKKTAASSSSSSSSPTTFILSFDKSTTALLPTDDSSQLEYSLPLSSTDHQNQGSKKTRSRSATETMDHIMSERHRRQELTRMFIALSATIPGLKKMDKAHVLREAINYVKELQERVKEMEQDMEKNGVDHSVITITRSHLCIEEEDGPNEEEEEEALPEVEARVLGKEVLIKIHCAKQKGILLNVITQLQRLHLYISTTNVLPFGNTLDITIIAQIGDKYKMIVKDLVKKLRVVAMLKSCDVNDQVI